MTAGKRETEKEKDTDPDGELAVRRAHPDIRSSDDVDPESETESMDGGDDGDAAPGEGGDGVLEVLRKAKRSKGRGNEGEVGELRPELARSLPEGASG